MLTENQKQRYLRNTILHQWMLRHNILLYLTVHYRAGLATRESKNEMPERDPNIMVNIHELREAGCGRSPDQHMSPTCAHEMLPRMMVGLRWPNRDRPGNAPASPNLKDKVHDVSHFLCVQNSFVLLLKNKSAHQAVELAEEADASCRRNLVAPTSCRQSEPDQSQDTLRQ